MLAIRCQLLGETFEGGAPEDPGAAEWPPSWMRLFSALVAVADHTDPPEVELLEKLEQLQPPAIVADPPALADAPEMAFERQAWVPTNKVEGKDATTTLPGRKNAARGWARFVPRSPDILYSWEDDPLTDAERAFRRHSAVASPTSDVRPPRSSSRSSTRGSSKKVSSSRPAPG